MVRGVSLRGSQGFYQGVFKGVDISTRLGHAYRLKKGGKGFMPFGGTLPAWKVNAIQIIPGNALLVVDVDNRAGNDGHKNLPCPIPEDTPTVKTQSGTGRHYWFKGDSRLHPKTDDKTRIDLLTGGTGIFAPPSKVKDGGEYRWLVPLTPENLRPLPEELFRFLCKLQERPPAPSKPAGVYQCAPGGSKSLYDLSQKQRECLLNDLERCRNAPEGKRSKADYAFIAWGLSSGIGEDELWGLCSGIGKFRKKGLSYFRFTVKNALRKMR